MTVAEQFAGNLVAARRRAGLTQEDVSWRAGLHRTEVSSLERGRRLPRIDTLAKLAGALQTDPGYLLKGIEWRAGEVRSGSFNGTDAQHRSAETDLIPGSRSAQQGQE